MIRVSAITQGKNVASARFRIRQYIPPLLKQDIIVHEYPALIYDGKFPGITGRIRQRYIFPLSAGFEFVKLSARLPQALLSNFYDVTWLSRSCFNSVAIENLLKNPLIYDIDDALWINNEKRVMNISARADYIFAGNAFIANKLEPVNKLIHIIPTAIDTDRFKPSEISDEDFFYLVWTGSRLTQHYLLSIEEPINQFIQKYRNVYLRIISDICPVFNHIPAERVQFIKWQPQIEASSLNGANIGIMPLFDSDWERGKCSYKMLQYMASEIPVVASPVGMNAELFNKGEIGYKATSYSDWYESLEALYNNKNNCDNYGKAGRQIVLQDYSLKVVTNMIVNIIKSIK